MAEASFSFSFSFSAAHEYPTIDPTSYDLIISGTGLPAALLAYSAAAAGKSVLHLDPNDFYGSHFSSLSPDSLPSFLRSHPTHSPSSQEPPSPSSYASYASVAVQPRRLYSEIETSGTSPESSRSFLLDLAGPRALYCADPAVDLLLRSGASHHVEFKSVDGSLLYWEGRLCPVPDSRQAVFKDRSLGLAEKSQMMRFLKLVQAHIGGESAAAEGATAGIPVEDLEIPFVEFLQKQRLPPKIRMIILYGIALADYDQENAEACKKLMNTREGLESLALYSSSIGRFPNAVGAFIYPMYGHGELSQAFCRCAAVKGALYVLRMPVEAILVDKETRQYKGVRLASGQDIFSHQLVMDPSFSVPSSILPPTNFLSEGLNASKLTGNVARGVCISRGSIQRDLSNILVVFPPRSLYSEQLTTIRALQLSTNVAVCSSGFFVVHLSTPCNDAILGKEYIYTAMNALFIPPELSSSEDSVLTNNYEGSEGESKPTLIWSCVYVQELTQASLDAICLCPMPDETLDYRNLLESTMKLFTNMYPQEEYFPRTPASENAEEDSFSVESN